MSGLINLHQTSEHRRSKYWLAQSLGITPIWARVMRDWRLTALERRLGLEVSSGSLSPQEVTDEIP